TQFSSKVKSIATITGRFGLTSGPQDRTLWYVKGGGAWAKTDYAVTVNGSHSFVGGIIDCEGVCLDGFNSFASATTSRSRWGWTVGTGIEFGLWGNWSTKIEYDYLHFGNNNLNFAGSRTFSDCSCVDSFNPTVGVKQEIHMVTVGLNYRFDWWR